MAKNPDADPTQSERFKQAPRMPAPDDGLTQSERFIKAAQELGTDDDPERFAERVKNLVMKRPEV